MRLRDLDAQFLYDVQLHSFRRSDGDSADGMQGIVFQCPACGIGLERGEEGGRRFLRGAHYIEALFSNPQGVALAPAEAGPTDRNGGHPRWSIVSGATIDDLTLAPSIDCNIPWKDAQGVEHPSSCKFHGFVRNGEAA